MAFRSAALVWTSSDFPPDPGLPPRLNWLFDVSRPGFAIGGDSCNQAPCDPPPVDAVTIAGVNAITGVAGGVGSINPHADWRVAHPDPDP